MRNMGLIAVLAALVALPSVASASPFWDGEAGTTAWTDAGNWNGASGGVLPGPGGSIYLGGYQSLQATALLTGTTDLNSAVAFNTANSGVLVGAVAGSNWTLNVGAGGDLQTRVLVVGQTNAYSGQTAPGQGTLNILGGGKVTVTAPGGVSTVFSYSQAGTSANVDISGTGSQLLINPMFSGATPTAIPTINMANGNNNGEAMTVKIRGGGQMLFNRFEYASATTGLVTVGFGGATTGKQISFELGDATGGGTLGETGTGTYGWRMDWASGLNAANVPLTLKGYGTVNIQIGRDYSSAFAGRIVADSMGASGQKTLDMTANDIFVQNLNTTAGIGAYNYGNVYHMGFYAQNHSQINFKPFPMLAKTNVEGAALTAGGNPNVAASAATSGTWIGHTGHQIYLANTLKFAFGHLWSTTTDTLTATLYSGDSIGLTTSGFTPMMLYKVAFGNNSGTFDFDNAALSFHYDPFQTIPNGLTEAALGLWISKDNGATWFNATTLAGVTMTPNATNKLLVTSAINKADLVNTDGTTWVAYGVVPEPATMALLLVGGIGVLARRRR